MADDRPPGRVRELDDRRRPGAVGLAAATPTETRRARDAALRGRKRNDFALTTNYRNSVEIFEVAAAGDPPGRAGPRAADGGPRAPASHPDRTSTVDRDGLPAPCASAVADLLGGVDGTVGVIAAQAARGRGRRVARPTDADPRLQVVTSLEAKGMEYDGVLVVEPGRDRRRVGVGVRVPSTSPCPAPPSA